MVDPRTSHKQLRCFSVYFVTCWFLLSSPGIVLSQDTDDAVAVAVDSKKEPRALSEELGEILEAQEKAWNAGDIDGFMQAYWKSPKLSFSSGGETRRGWKVTRDRYKSRYPDEKTMGKLRFSKLQVQALGDEAALMLGQWELKRMAPLDDLGGNFSLVWRFVNNRWVIIHDHTSSLQ